ncbi:MAG: hypothetical protein PHS34_07620 [Candidatus Omnitrophica bacterium]|nr:hypothetical protein [Candidatus Omnitrophota bacterium]MDD5551110.1 hypothetical protein [Candidatus Omnitrophota bacterium]
MEETKIEETIETKEEEILTPEEVEELEGKTDEELTDEEKKNKRLYARAKAAEEKRKADKAKFDEEKSKLEAKIMELEEVKNQEKKETTQGPIDPIEFAKQVRKLSTLDDEEISYAQILARGMSRSVEEVVATDEFKTWSDARKEKIKNDELSQIPNGKQGGINKKDPFFEKFSQDLPERFDFTKK